MDHTSFALGACAGVGVMTVVWAASRLQRQRSWSWSSHGPPATAAAAAAPAAAEPTPNEALLLDEQLSRTSQMLGETGMGRVREAVVTVVGLGGVGSHAAHMLARSGVRRLRLVDFDLVTLSSLNRHAVAVREDVGVPKAVATAKRLRSFAGPTLEVDARVTMFQAKDADQLLLGSDFVLDCIDDLQTKIELLAACTRLGLRVMSSLGAGGKVDPTRLRFAKLEDVTYDAMATALRYKSRGVVLSPDIEYVYSTETAQVKLLDLNEAQAENPSEFGALPNFRLRVQPVLGTSPSSFGVAMAARVLTELAKARQFTPASVDSISAQVVQQMLQKTWNREQAVFKRTPDRFTEGDGALLVSVFRRRCPLSGSKLGTNGIKMEFARLRTDQPLALDNALPVRRDVAEAMYNAHGARLARRRSEEDAPALAAALTAEEIDHQDVTDEALREAGEVLRGLIERA